MHTINRIVYRGLFGEGLTEFLTCKFLGESPVLSYRYYVRLIELLIKKTLSDKSDSEEFLWKIYQESSLKPLRRTLFRNPVLFWLFTYGDLFERQGCLKKLELILKSEQDLDSLEPTLSSLREELLGVVERSLKEVDVESFFYTHKQSSLKYWSGRSIAIVSESI